MRTLSVVLLLISIGTIVGPIGAVAFVYRDNLVQLIVPPQISNLTGGINHIMNDSGNNNNNNNSDNGNNSNNNNSGGVGGFIDPVFVSDQINNETQTFTVTVNVTNNFGYDLTVNSINATVESSQKQLSIGNNKPRYTCYNTCWSNVRGNRFRLLDTGCGKLCVE